MINLIAKKNSAEDIIKKRAKIASHLMREYSERSNYDNFTPRLKADV
jgi:hypothetical protein